MNDDAATRRVAGAAVAILLLSSVLGVQRSDDTTSSNSDIAPTIALEPAEDRSSSPDDAGPSPAADDTTTEASSSPATDPAPASSHESSGPSLPAMDPGGSADTEQGETSAGSAAPASATAPAVTTSSSSSPPAHERASQDPRDPSTTRWALLIGINEHSGRTRDNLGSRQDAEDLRRHLLNLGWRDDHILLLTDGGATRERIEQGIAWLARKTNERSLAVFHYSGHTKQWHGWDADRDGETTDEAIWPSDNDHMTDRELVDRLAQVNAGRMWVNFGACEAYGFADKGLRRRGRILTFSSREDEKSYENPRVRNSVWGYHLIDQALLHGKGDLNGDGDITVQEAWNYANPRSTRDTERARTSHGPQHAVVTDDAPNFSLRIPPPPKRSNGSGEGGGGGDDGQNCLLLCPQSSADRRR